MSAVMTGAEGLIAMEKARALQRQLDEAKQIIEMLAGYIDGVVQRDVDNCTFIHSKAQCYQMHTPEELQEARGWLA